MYSKGIRYFIGLGLLLIVAVGCAGENEFSSAPPNVRFDGAKFNCLKEADTYVSQFIEGNLPAGELQSFWNCLDLAIVQFVRYVSGKDGQSYTPQEMARFLDEYFLEGRGLQNETRFLEELMEIKKLFVGGNTQVVSHYDLYVRTRAIIKDFKKITLDLNPHMAILYKGLSENKQKSGLNPAEVEAATLALKKAGHDLAELITAGRHFYSFSHLQAFIEELEKFLRKTDPDFEFVNGKKYLPIFAEFKGLLVSQPYDLIRSEDWVRLFESLTHVLTWGLQYRLYVEDQGWDQGEPLEYLARIVNEALNEIDRGLSAQPTKSFTYLDLDRLLDLLGDEDLLPIDLDAKTAKDAIRRLGGRVLKVEAENSGLTAADFLAIRSEFQRWLDAQRYVSEFLRDGELAESGGPGEMAMLIRTPWPLLRDDEGRIEFSSATYRGQYDLDGLTALNWQRAIIRLLMRGYTTQSSADGAKGLTQTEFIALAEDWHVLAEKLGLFEPGEAASMAKKIFMEANLFMPSANGNDLIDFIEGTQYLAFGISGLNGSGVIKDQLLVLCQSSSAPSQFDAKCLRKELFDQRDQLLPHLPQFLEFLGSSRGRFEQFVTYAEATTRDGQSDRPFTRGEVIEMLVLMQYIETYFAMYDQDSSATISADETISSFPVFNRSLDEIVKSSYGINMGDGDLLGLFTYLFKYGQPPQATFAGILKFLNWRWRPDKWNYQADRTRVIQILAELNSRR